MTDTAWQALPLEQQRQEFAKQALAQELVSVMREWARVYGRLARDLADAFGEAEVLDILEQVWWDLQYEGGATWREEFERDPEAALAAMELRWRHGPNSLSAYFGTIAHPVRDARRWELVTYSCYHDIFRELGERKLGLSWCMSDLAAVRGWSSRVVMDFPHVLLRGAAFCHQIRRIVEEADPALDHWSRQLSEQYGWRSAQKLEEP